MSRSIINPDVYREAELFTDGAITDALLADIAFMRGLPLYVEGVAQTDAERAAIEARIAADAATDRARGAENARRRHAAILDAHKHGKGVACYTTVHGNPRRETVSASTVRAARRALGITV